MTDIEQRLNELVSGFINDLSKLARQVALDTLSGALVGAVAAPSTGSSGSRATRGGRGMFAASGRPKGAKRPLAEIEQLMSMVFDYVKNHPGERIEQINAQLGTKTGDLALPLKKLIA